MAFDPDAFLAEAQPAPAFDPDAFLAEAQPAPAFDPDAFLAEAQPAPAFDPDAFLAEAQPATEFDPDEFLTSDLGPRTSDLGPPTSRFQPPMSDLGSLELQLQTPEELAATGRVSMAPSPMGTVADEMAKREAADLAEAVAAGRVPAMGAGPSPFHAYEQALSDWERVRGTEDSLPAKKRVEAAFAALPAAQQQDVEATGQAAGLVEAGTGFMAAGVAQPLERLGATMLGRATRAGVHMAEVGAAQGAESGAAGAAEGAFTGFLTGLGIGVAGRVPLVPLVGFWKSAVAQGMDPDDALAQALAVTLVGPLMSARGGAKTEIRGPRTEDRGTKVGDNQQVYDATFYREMIARARAGDAEARAALDRLTGAGTAQGAGDPRSEVRSPRSEGPEGPVAPPVEPPPVVTSEPVTEPNRFPNLGRLNTEPVEPVEVVPPEPVAPPAVAPGAPKTGKPVVAATPEGVKVEVPMPPKKADALGMKEQKKFLLAEIDTAVKVAPDTSDMPRTAEQQAAWDDAQTVTALEWSDENNLPIFRTWAGKYGIPIENDGVPTHPGPLREFIIEAARQAARPGYNTVQIEVPGDGTFTVHNDKETLAKFRDIVSKRFPTTKEKPTAYGHKKSTAASVVAAVDRPKVHEFTGDAEKLLEHATSSDEEREHIQQPHMEGKIGEAVATDGRRLSVIIGVKGKTTKRMSSPDEKGSRFELTFPNYSQTIPGYRAGKLPDIRGRVNIAVKDTEQLIRQLRQASEMTTAVNEAVVLGVTKDGTVVIQSGSKDEEGEYDSMPEEPHAALMALRPQYLDDALTMLRRTGSKGAILSFSGSYDGDPVVVVGDSAYSVIMPMDTRGVFRRSVEGKSAGERIEKVGYAVAGKKGGGEVAASGIYPFTKEMDIRNLDALPRGTGARYLEVVKGEPDEAGRTSFVAKKWRHKPVATEGTILIEFGEKRTPQKGADGRPLADAAVAGEGMPGYAAVPERPPSNVPPRADDASFTMFPLELPEIIDFAVQLGGGKKYPKIRDRLRVLNGNAAGVFYHLGPHIEFRADIFNLVQVSDRMRLAEEARAWGESEFTPAPNGPSKEQAVKERFEFKLAELRDERLKQNPRYASAVAAHEVGHWIDFLPDEMTDGRGNILGHVAALKRYVLSMLNEAPGTPEQLLTSKERGALRRDAMKEAGKRPKKTDKGAMAVWSAEVARLYQEKVEAEAANRGLVTRKTIIGELEPAIAWWNGTPEMPGYYVDPVEMYAEAVSILVNNPAGLAKRAPSFWKLWNNYLSRRPDVADRWSRYQEDAALGRIQSERDRRQGEGLVEASRAYEANLRRRFVLTPAERIDALAATLFRGSYPITRRMNRAKSEVKSPAMKALQDYVYRHSSAQAYLMALSNDVARPVLEDAGVPAVEWQMFLQNSHIAENRQDIASMLGMNPAAAVQSLAEQRARLGEAAYSAMERAQVKFFEHRQKYYLDLLASTRFTNPELQAEMEKRSAYTRVAAVKVDQDPMADLFAGRMGGEVSARIMKQKGFLGVARDPFTATIEQDIRGIVAARRNELVRQIHEVLVETGDPLFKEAEERWDKNINGKVPVLGSNDRVSTLVYLEDGKPRAFWAPNAVVEFLENADPATMAVWKNVVRAGLRNLKLLYTAWNYGFPIFNYRRDKEAWVKRLPGWKSVHLGTWRYDRFKGPARAAASSILDGKPNADALRFLDRNMSMVFPQGLEPTGISARDKTTALQRIERGYDLQRGALGSEVTRRQAALQWMKRHYMNRMRRTELETKLAGMLYLDARYPDMPEQEKQRAVQMLAGSPDFPSKPSGNHWMDAIVPFFNPWARGKESEWEAFRKDPWRVFLAHFQYSLLPKLLLLALSSPLWMRKLVGDEKAKELEGVLDRIPDRYKANYDIPFAWWDPTDPTRSKVMFVTLAKEEENRFAGGVFWKILNGTSPDSILDFGADQMPGINPILTTAAAWGTFARGKNPGAEIMTDTEMDAGAGLIPMLKFTANELGGGLVMRLPRENLREVNLTRLERLLRLPVVGNTLGRVLRVSDRGYAEKIQRTGGDVEENKAKMRHQAYRDALAWGRNGTLTPEAMWRFQSGARALAAAGGEGNIWMALPKDRALEGYYTARVTDYMKGVTMEKTPVEARELMKAPVSTRMEFLRSQARPMMQP